MMATMHTLGIVVPSNVCCTRRNYNSRSEAEFCGGKIVPRRARGFVAGVEAVDLAELFNLRRNAPERVREVQAVGKSSRIWASVSEVDEAPKKIKKVEQKQLILKPPLSDSNLAERFLSSPQLQVKKFPLLSSCLPVVNLNRLDQEWIDEYLIEVKDALGYSIEILEAPEDSPASHLDSLLFLAFQHKFSKRGRTKLVGIGHSRLAFLGQYVLELAFSELLLQMYPTERVGSLRERVFNVTNKRVLPKWLYKASLNAIVFPAEETEQIPKDDRQVAVRYGWCESAV